MFSKIVFYLGTLWRGLVFYQMRIHRQTHLYQVQCDECKDIWHYLIKNTLDPPLECPPSARSTESAEITAASPPIGWEEPEDWPGRLSSLWRLSRLWRRTRMEAGGWPARAGEILTELPLRSRPRPELPPLLPLLWLRYVGFHLGNIEIYGFHPFDVALSFSIVEMPPSHLKSF